MATVRRPAGAKCPMCDKPVQREHRPFCSRRCADLDLAQWLGGSYRIPAENQESLPEEMARMQESDPTDES